MFSGGEFHKFFAAGRIADIAVAREVVDGRIRCAVNGLRPRAREDKVEDRGHGEDEDEGRHECDFFGV